MRPTYHDFYCEVKENSKHLWQFLCVYVGGVAMCEKKWCSKDLTTTLASNSPLRDTQTGPWIHWKPKVVHLSPNHSRLSYLWQWQYTRYIYQDVWHVQDRRWKTYFFLFLRSCTWTGLHKPRIPYFLWSLYRIEFGQSLLTHNSARGATLSPFQNGRRQKHTWWCIARGERTTPLIFKEHAAPCFLLPANT